MLLQNLFLLYAISNSISLGANIQGVVLNSTFTLAYTLPWERGWLLGQQVGAAIILGVEEVYRRNILPGYDIEWVWRDSHCEPRRGMQMMVEMWESVGDLDGIIGDGCSVVCQPVSLLAAAWGIPVISWGCAGAGLSNKDIYPTFTRVQGTWLTLGPVYNGVADLMGWNRVGIITSTEDLWRMAAEATKVTMETSGKDIIFRAFESTAQGNTINKKKLASLKEIILELKHMVYIFYVFAYQTDLQNTLLIAMENGMFNGQYAFVCNEYHNGLVSSHFPNPSPTGWAITNGLIGVGIKDPSGEDYNHFLTHLVEVFQDPMFDHMPHIPPDTDIKTINSFAGKILLLSLSLP